MGGEDFEAFVAARYASLVKAAYVLVADRGRAEDLVQTALLKAYPVWRRQAPDSPEAYVRTVMLRLAMREWRKPRDVPMSEPPESAGAVHDLPLALALHQALLTLPVDARAVLVLRYLYGLSEEETASELGCARGTVKSRSSRALTALRTGGLLDGVEVGDA